MKTFPSYDYTLCDNSECGKKDNCKRWLTHLKAVSENYPYPIAYIIPDGKECKMYVESEEE